MKKVILSMMGLLLITGCFKESKEEYYKKLETNMYNDFEKYYKERKDNMKDELKDKTLIIKLKTLQIAGYDLTNYKNPSTLKECDLDKTYAMIIQKPDAKKYPGKEYVIEVKYNCDGYKSENYKELTTKKVTPTTEPTS